MSRLRPQTRVKYGPLTEHQKTQIEDMAFEGYRDTQIANRLNLGEYQVGEYRRSLGLSRMVGGAENQHGLYDPTTRALRPAHVIGIPFSPEWYRSANDAFEQTVIQLGWKW